MEHNRHEESALFDAVDGRATLAGSNRMEILLFSLGLLALHWREKDEAAAKRQAEAPEGDAPADPTPEPANA